MRKVGQLVVVPVVGLGLAVVGCGPTTTTGKDRMGGDKMNTGKMEGDKMSGKMEGDKMSGDKMGGDKKASSQGDHRRIPRAHQERGHEE